MCDQLAAVPPVMAAPIPMLTASSTSSVQYVERTERILVNSEFSVPRKPARPEAGGSAARTGWVCVVAAMSVHPFADWERLLCWPAVAGPVLHAVRGQLHEGRLEGGADHGQLVQPDAVIEGQIADLGRGEAVHGQ